MIRLRSKFFHSFIQRSVLNYLLPVICCALFSCTATSYLKEGEAFYDGAEIHLKPHGRVREKKVVKSNLEELVDPKPNSKFLGNRPFVWVYYVMGTPKKKNGVRGWIKREIGDAPVFMSDVKSERTSQVLQGNLFNNGYFESEVAPEVNKKKYKGTVTYHVDLFPPFTINEIIYPTDTMFRRMVEEIKKEPLISAGQNYSLENMKSELARIEALVENHGYYYFDDRYLLFEADSTIGNRKVDLTLTVVPGMPEKVQKKYVMRDINIYNDYFLQNDSARKQAKVVEVKGYHYSSTKEAFRPEIIADVINLTKDSLYRRDDHNYTISHLMGLNNFKFVNIKYTEAPDSLNGLNADIFLTPLLKKSLRFETQMVSKTNNFVGPGAGITFTNRNFLRGAERFEFKISGSYEWQVGTQQSTAINAIQFSAEASLSIPRMLLPIKIYKYSRRYLPSTSIRAGIDFQRRIGYFQTNSFNVGFGYIWRETVVKSHEFYPIDITYVKVSEKTDAFQDLLDENPTLEESFEDQFIPGMRYSFTWNTQLREQDNKVFGETRVARSNFYFRGNVGFAGNLFNWIRTKTSSSDEERPYSVFGQPYSQYVLGDVDFRYYWQMDKRNRLVARVAFGSGYPYGNSTTLPYVKQFASGGSSSVRAFPARSIGPGTFNVYDDPSYEESGFVDQRGDVKIEGNIEYRYDIFKSMKGAVFVDAGNIWMWNDDQRPEAEFKGDTFMKELAVGAGLGIRFDFSFFILRFDFAFPLRKPYLPEGERWVIDDIDLLSKDWRKENLILNIAIGYPF